MSEKINTVIKVLSEVYDIDSKDTYVSMYLNKQKNYQKFLDKRIKAITTILKGDILKNFTETINLIENKIKKENWNNIAIFSSNKHNFYKHVVLPVETDNLLVIDSSPYLRLLARIHDEWESFTLVLVNTNYAKIFSVSMNELESTKSLSVNIMKKHKKGGMSQARFNRLRHGAIHNFLKEVVEILEKREDKQIIVAGPGTAKTQLIKLFPKNMVENIIVTIDINIDDEKKDFNFLE